MKDHKLKDYEIKKDNNLKLITNEGNFKSERKNEREMKSIIQQNQELRPTPSKAEFDNTAAEFGGSTSRIYLYYPYSRSRNIRVRVIITASNAVKTEYTKDYNTLK